MLMAFSLNNGVIFSYEKPESRKRWFGLLPLEACVIGSFRYAMHMQWR